MESKKVDGGYEVTSCSYPKKKYLVSKDVDGNNICSCPAFSFNKSIDCKHIKYVNDNPTKAMDAIWAPEETKLVKLDKIKIPEMYMEYTPYKDSKTKKVHTVPTVTVNGYMYAAYKMPIDMQPKRIEVIPVQFPCEDNKWTAFAQCTIETMDGKTFTDFAEANKENVKLYTIHPHLPRMASTRARGRALRVWLFPYVGYLCSEELYTVYADKEVAQGLLVDSQKKEIRKELVRFNDDLGHFDHDQSITLKCFVESLTVSEATDVVVKLKEMTIFDYQSFVALKRDVKCEDTPPENTQ